MHRQLGNSGRLAHEKFVTADQQGAGVSLDKRNEGRLKIARGRHWRA